MRLILMGTGPFAVPSFKAIAAHGHEILHVVTRPIVSNPSKKESPISPVRQWALDNGLPIADPASINDPQSILWLGQLQADLMVVCDYGQILSKDALSTTRLGGINLHGSLLPRHRGAAPVQWSILSGDKLAGISTIHMTPSLDGGPVLHQCSTEILPHENSAELELRLGQLGVEITLASIELLSRMPNLDDCQDLGTVQDKSLATKAPRLAKEDGELNFHYGVRYLDRLIRGLQPWPGTFAHLQLPDGKLLRAIIPQAVPWECDWSRFDLGELADGLVPGDMLFGDRLERCKASYARLEEYPLWIVAVDGLLGIPCIQPSGKRLMSSQEFLRGHSRYPKLRIPCEPGTHRLLNKMTNS
jgi:methionyl-tRNA formyltransferase